MPVPTTSDSEPVPAASAGPHRGAKIAAALCGIGFVLTVAVQLPLGVLEYSRFGLPKDFVFNLSVFTTALVLLASAERFEFDVFTVLVAGFLMLGLASVFAAESSPLLAVRPFGIYLSFGVLLLSVRSIVRRGARDWLLGGLCCATAFSASGVLFESYLGLENISTVGRGPGGWLGNRNFNAHMIAIALPAVAVFAATARHKATRYLGLLATTAAAVVVVLTRTRAAWLGLLVGLAVLAIALPWFRTRTRGASWRRAWLAVASSLLMGLAIGGLLPNQLVWESETPVAATLSSLTDYQQGSGAGRLVQYRHTLRMVADQPFLGVGLGNWQALYPAYTSGLDAAKTTWKPLSARAPTSEWLAIAAQMGLPASALAAAIFATLASLAMRVLRETSGEIRERLFAAALLVTLPIVVVVGVFDFLVLRPTTAFSLAIVLGGLAPMRSLAPLSWSFPVGSLMRSASLAAIIGISLAVLWPSWNQCRALYARATLPVADGLLESVRLVPWDYVAHNELSKHYLSAGDCDRAIAHADASRSLNVGVEEEQIVRYVCSPLVIPDNPHPNRDDPTRI